MAEAITLETWFGMGVAIVLFWGIATWALVRTLRQEERKVSLLERQRAMDTYSPEALEELREFVETNPEDPYADDARAQYNQCVDRLKAVEETFYDWSDEQIRSLERL
ncbi:hypothetical protein [Natronobeatus ordinarius]|uniref:hypothetical protein n=1 Tax=Natronobeatus ordinarius TaxID=2963433 RepID=UPI0020CEB800|nr:hypothetical protein [Natronobeatus ordinarius]